MTYMINWVLKTNYWYKMARHTVYTDQGVFIYDFVVTLFVFQQNFDKIKNIQINYKTIFF